jgi:hypothetical protein
MERRVGCVIGTGRREIKKLLNWREITATGTSKMSDSAVVPDTNEGVEGER